MKKIAFAIALGVCLSVTLVSGAGAYPHGWHGGPYWGWYGPGPWWGYPYSYPYPQYYPYAPYPSYDSSVPAVPNVPQQSYWYYCKDAKAYYPYVQSCPGGWTQVIPNSSQTGNGAGNEAVPSPPQKGNEGGVQ